jgi:hypothetical protein
VNVSAVIVTRGDQPLMQVLDSLSDEWEILVWDNGARRLDIFGERIEGYRARRHYDVVDLMVYGRYAAIAHAKNDLIYVQDDDCIVSDPQAIVNEWMERGKYPFDGRGSPYGSDPRDFVDHVVCNMPAAFRARHFYDEHSLVGFGAAFHREAPAEAFQYAQAIYDLMHNEPDWFNRTCDIIFTALTPRVLVDVPYEDLPWASADNRMWKQPDHQASREKMLDLVLGVRDAARV